MAGKYFVIAGNRNMETTPEMTEEEKYDVVLDVLQKHYDKLWDMSKNKEDWGMMDFIRLEQMDQLKKAMTLWKNRPKEN